MYLISVKAYTNKAPFLALYLSKSAAIYVDNIGYYTDGCAVHLHTPMFAARGITMIQGLEWSKDWFESLPVLLPISSIKLCDAFCMTHLYHIISFQRYQIYLIEDNKSVNVQIEMVLDLVDCWKRLMPVISLPQINPYRGCWGVNNL